MRFQPNRMEDAQKVVICSKCADSFKNWDAFQRHSCVMGALKELQIVRNQCTTR